VATWSLALAELEVSSPGSLVLLRIAAFLAPEDIPFRLLLPEHLALPEAGLDAQVLAQVRALCGGPLALDDAMAGLRRYSLIGPPGRRSACTGWCRPSPTSLMLRASVSQVPCRPLRVWKATKQVYVCYQLMRWLI
jgi:hypothetical protein